MSVYYLLEARLAWMIVQLNLLFGGIFFSLVTIFEIVDLLLVALNRASTFKLLSQLLIPHK
jgi:hypothetical protein